MSFYQYEPPVAMFSMAEVDKYNRYEGSGMALFATKANAGLTRGQRIANINAARATKNRAALGSVQNTANTAFRGAKRLAGTAVGGVGRGATLAGGAVGMGLGYAAQGAQAVGSGINKLGTLAAMNPKTAGALLAASAAGAVGGTIFMRRRRSKTGKMIVEQVRR
jgi:hypothetical protein